MLRTDAGDMINILAVRFKQCYWTVGGDNVPRNVAMRQQKAKKNKAAM